MKLSYNMLNFLGYVDEDGSNFIDRSTAVALAYPFGITSALKNNLIEAATYTINPAPGLPLVPGVPYGRVYDGYKLTDRGLQLSEFGKRYRRNNEQCLAEAQAALETQK